MRNNSTLPGGRATGRSLARDQSRLITVSPIFPRRRTMQPLP